MPRPEINSMSFAEDIILPGPGDVIGGKYRVDGVVGRGGMGVVLSAQHIQLKQQVALKLLLVPGLDQAKRIEAAARFVKEGQAAAQLTSDHVVRIFDVGTLEDGAPFMVMELLRGDDLSTVIRERGAAPVELALEYLAQACDAIGEAHALGIVHRDLKPSNLFLCRRSDGRPLVKVLDFGISKVLRPEQEAAEGDLTATRAVVGSPLYMSPEQLRDAKRVDPRTDVWSLGMVLYELITGGPAFQSNNLLGLTAAIAADAPVPPRIRRPDISEELDAIILRCLEKDPAKRFQSVAGLVEAITPLLPKGHVQSSAEYTSKRLESLLEAAAERAFRDHATFRGSELEVPPSAASWSGAAAARGAMDDNSQTTVTTGDYSRKPSHPPPRAAAITLGSAPVRVHESVPRFAADGSSTLVSSTASSMRPDTSESEPAPPIEEAKPPGRGRLILFALLTLFALAVLASLLFSPERDRGAVPTASAEAMPVSPPRASAPSVAAPSEAPTPVASAEPKGEPSAASSSFPQGAARKTAPRKTIPAQPRPADSVDIKLER